MQTGLICTVEFRPQSHVLKVKAHTPSIQDSLGCQFRCKRGSNHSHLKDYLAGRLRSQPSPTTRSPTGTRMKSYLHIDSGLIQMVLFCCTTRPSPSMQSSQCFHRFFDLFDSCTQAFDAFLLDFGTAVEESLNQFSINKSQRLLCGSSFATICSECVERYSTKAINVCGKVLL